MRFKIIAAALLSAVLAASSPAAAFAADGEGSSDGISGYTNFNANYESIAKTLSGIFDDLPEFASFTGIIVEVTPFSGDETKSFVMLEDEDGNIVNFVLSAETYIEANTELLAGTEATGWYNARRPVIMIYPPQYAAVAFWTRSGDVNVKLDRFDDSLTSSDGELKLNISEETDIIFVDSAKNEPSEGLTANEALAGKVLMVFYTVTTRSIPAQTTPSKIIVLPEAQPDFADAGQEAPEIWSPEIVEYEIVVEGDVAGYTPIVISESGTLMAPLRIICEALGEELEWDDTSKTVNVGTFGSIVIGSSVYVNGEGQAMLLEEAPIIVDDRTFVPLSFFLEALGINNAYYFETQIVVDNFEIME